MAKGDKFYFENLEKCTGIAKNAAEYLVECLKNYSSDNISEMLGKMHRIEHSADMKKHEMSEALAKAFVTPIDREDLDMLSRILDDVVDTIEEILQKFYIYDIKKIHPSAIEFAEKLVKSCDLLQAVMGEFESFKKSKKIRSLIIEINDVEEECDRIYLSAMRELTVTSKDALEIISWRKIYEIFEECADACEHVSDCIDSVIMKNT